MKNFEWDRISNARKVLMIIIGLGILLVLLMFKIPDQNILSTASGLISDPGMTVSMNIGIIMSVLAVIFIVALYELYHCARCMRRS